MEDFTPSLRLRTYQNRENFAALGNTLRLHGIPKERRATPEVRLTLRGHHKHSADLCIPRNNTITFTELDYPRPIALPGTKTRNSGAKT
jgi:hypothetical protein